MASTSSPSTVQQTRWYSSVPRFEPPAERPAVSPRPSTVKPAFKASGVKLGKKAKRSELLEVLGGEMATPEASTLSTPLPTTPAAVHSPRTSRG
ncbi:coatomer subunit delta [Ceratobasidium sp. AG-Ba]|nr:coatomer subunit delta [Ceratobasidium sp. AG-Ba]QRW08871.1 coatomer subunit delta [Ceratobasidium sp. AG-Ba]